MKTCKWLIVLVAVLVTAPLALAEDKVAEKAPAAQGKRMLPPEVREQVKALVTAFRADAKPLREALRAEVQKLRELHKSGADKEVMQTQLAVVKAKAQALRSRAEQFRGDMKAALPPEAYAKFMQRFQERREQFLDDHPRLKKFAENRKAHQGQDGAKKSAE